MPTRFRHLFVALATCALLAALVLVTSTGSAAASPALPGSPSPPLAERTPTDDLHEVALPKGAPVHIEKLCYSNGALLEHRQDEAMHQEWVRGWRLDHITGLPSETQAVRQPGGYYTQKGPLTCFLAVFVPRTI